MLLDNNLIRERLVDLGKREDLQILYAMVSGSHLYGVDHAESDIDIRFVYKHPLNKILSLSSYGETIEMTEDKYDIVGTEISKFLKAIMSGNFQMLLQCFVPDQFQIISNDKLQDLSKKCITKKLSPFLKHINPGSFGKRKEEGYQRFIRDGEEIRFPKSLFYTYAYLINGYFLLKKENPVFNFETMWKVFEEETKYKSLIYHIKNGQEYSFEDIDGDMGRIKGLLEEKNLEQELSEKDKIEFNQFLLGERFGIYQLP